MGLLTSVNNLNYTLQEKENEKLRREKERIKAKEEKEAKERIKSEIEQFLHIEFRENLQKFGSNYIIEYYNINKVHALLGAIWSQYIIEKEIKLKNKKTYTTRIIQYEKFIEDYFYKKYYKILKEEEEIAKKNEQYIYYNAILTQNTEEEQQQQQQQVQYTQAKKQYNYNTIYTILKIIFYIICAPIAILVLILISACKNQK